MCDDPRAVIKAEMRWRLTVLAVVVLISLAIPVFITVVRTYLVPHAAALPAPRPGPITLERQVETYTCGVHALNMVYAAYGLEPALERLEARMGSGKRMLAWNVESTGTLHPDLFMALGQDHFQVRCVDPAEATAWAQLIEHLTRGHLAILLIERRENGNLHWIVAAEPDFLDEQIMIYDSMARAPYREGPDLLTDHAVSVLLVEPRVDTPRSSRGSMDHHMAGTKELARAAARTRALAQRRQAPSIQDKSNSGAAP